MDRKIVWSPEALADLVEIRGFIARDSESYAASLIERLLVAVDRLPDFPQYGRRVPELDQEAIREIIVDRYRVIYRLNTHSIDLAAIVHGARDLSTALSTRLH